MAVASAFAALFAFAQHKLALLPSGFNINETGLRSLATVNNEMIAVALAAGVAGMLAFETRASSGVGVAISVTTIPAAAYLGVAAGLGVATKALGALVVLSTNVAMIIAGAPTLQRPLANRRGTPRGRSRPAKLTSSLGPSRRLDRWSACFLGPPVIRRCCWPGGGNGDRAIARGPRVANVV